MAEQIEDIIANISEKLDSQFQSGEYQAQHFDDSLMKDLGNGIIKTDQPEIQDNPEEDHTPIPIQAPKNDLTNSIVVAGEQHQHEEHKSNHEEPIDKDAFSQEEQGEAYQEQGEEQDENKYKDLSRKLETALKKISSSKNGFPTMNSMSHSNSNVLLRFDEYERKKEKMLEEKRQEEQNRKRKKLQQKPLINKKSRMIMEQVSQKPIYERFEKIVEDRKKRIQENQELKKQKEEKQYEQFMEEFNKHHRKNIEVRDSETYFQEMVAWKEKIKQRNKQEKQRKDQKAKDSLTFTPTINQKSVRMLKNQKRAPIQDREVQRPKTQQPQECTFKPKINKRIVK